MKEMVGGCCVCSDERGWPDNPLVYCDGNGCTVAVHQACYGIVTVPTGPWFCRKCESPETKGKVRCELCPSRSGAHKRTDTGGWAHVVCALYIPEVRFGNVTSMEPIVLRLIPPERYNKTCYICHDIGKPHRATAGACMQCNKSGCKQQFHVTCAQSLGLLCEEAGNYLDNVKYCGYCQHHYSKLKKGGNVKTIPPYKPVSHDSHSSDSSCEKEGGGSPQAGGGGTPTHAGKAKGPGRKSSHSGSGKSTPASKQSSTPQAMDKKKSPSRRGSSTGDGGSKSSTPAPSPQHTPEAPQPVKVATSQPSTPKVPSPPRVPKAAEAVGVISSVASAVAAATTTVQSASTAASTPAVQSKPTFQESVITNTDSMDTKHTKKRKAAEAAAAAALSAANAEAAHSTAAPPTATSNIEPPTSQPQPAATWEQQNQAMDLHDPEKGAKKPKMDHEAPMQQYAPPPAHSPAAPQPSPRSLQNPLPGPSGMNPPPSAIRSPPRPLGPMPSEMRAMSPHIFHQPQKQATVESSIGGHPAHQHGHRAWSGLNVAYEHQQPHQQPPQQAHQQPHQQHPMAQDLNKPGVSGMAGHIKENMGQMPSMPPGPIRNKKRAAMANQPQLPPPSAIQMASTSSQGMPGVRRPPQQTPPMYQETLKESPPASPGSDRIMKKPEPKMIHPAPHMLGNELNPESGAAARLQEQLTAELAAHAAGSGGPDPLVAPPLINKAGGSMARGSSSAQSLDQLLERQWEQGSQFLMEQAQHFDIASLLSCLHQLRTENVRLEEHVSNLLQRRDHLLAVNARLAIPLTAAPTSGDVGRCSREGGQIRAPPPPPRPEPMPMPPDRSHHPMAVDQRSHQMMMREVQQKPS